MVVTETIKTCVEFASWLLNNWGSTPSNTLVLPASKKFRGEHGLVHDLYKVWYCTAMPRSDSGFVIGCSTKA